MQKLLIVADDLAARDRLLECPLLSGCAVIWSPAEHGAWLGVVEPLHAHVRFELEAAVQGIHVLPGHHDPTPVGDAITSLLPHVSAKPAETMREIAQRLYRKHGPHFHPDT